MMGSYFHKGVLYLPGTWLSYPGPIPDDLPEEFSLEDMEALNIEPDYEGAARAERQRKLFEDIARENDRLRDD